MMNSSTSDIVINPQQNGEPLNAPNLLGKRNPEQLTPSEQSELAFRNNFDPLFRFVLDGTDIRPLGFNPAFEEIVIDGMGIESLLGASGLSKLGTYTQNLLHNKKASRSFLSYGPSKSNPATNENGETRYGSQFLRFSINTIKPFIEIRIEQPDDIIDKLTGFYNTSVLDTLREEINFRLLNEKGFAFTLVVADSKKLKEINDTLGHPAGDEYIRAGADSLSAEIPSILGGRITDINVRGVNGPSSGSDEYSRFCLGTGRNNNEAIMQRVMKAQAEAYNRFHKSEIDAGKLQVISELEHQHRLVDIAILSSDSDWFALERKMQAEGNISQAVTCEIMEAVADRLRYIVKESGRLVDTFHEEGNQERVQKLGTVQFIQSQMIELMLRKGIVNIEKVKYFEEVYEELGGIVDQMGFSNEDFTAIQLALLGHEVGSNRNIEVDEELNKRIDPRCERARIPKYSELFYNELYKHTGEEVFQRVAKIVSRHHERPDGNGYPGGYLAGEKIDITNKDDRIAQVINIADAYYSMCSIARVERGVLTPQEAIAKIREMSGQFDSGIVEQMVPILQKFLNNPIPNINEV